MLQRDESSPAEETTQARISVAGPFLKRGAILFTDHDAVRTMLINSGDDKLSVY